MQSSNHIGKIVKQHADAVEKGKVSARKRTTKSKSLASVPNHRAFVPMVTIWGGLLFTLIIAVLPDQAIARVSAVIGVYLPLIGVRLVLALAVGIGGALLGFAIANALAKRAKLHEADGAVVSAFKSRNVQPINPIADLGSESLDAPIKERGQQTGRGSEDFSDISDTEPTGHADVGELARRGLEMEVPEDLKELDQRHKKGERAFTRKHFKDALIESCEGPNCEAAPHSQDRSVLRDRQPMASKFAPLTAESTTPRPEKLRSIELDEFAKLPGRNAVWIEEPAADYAAQHDFAAMSQPESVAESGIEKLRQTPTEDLSLVEMIERLAAALHERQTQERAELTEGEIGREVALAEALKTLSLFTEQGFDKNQSFQRDDSQIGETEIELRNALAKLNDVRGAA
ncbi:MAG: hypothetical protein AAGI28_10955 [Pseudomonadota bacterium]